MILKVVNFIQQKIMNKQKAIEWIGTHHVGTSSRTMWCALMDIKPDDIYLGNFDVPHDADDFSRCFDLVEFAEVTNGELLKIPKVFPYWKPIIEIWSELVNAYITHSRRVYELLNDKHDEVMHLKGFEKISDGYWVKRKR